ncbi:putative P-loop containing nucleoside triphosphate hydrolase, leucine-rich repeat domain, L [Rosa chinensis]|uniref:Putative P-loop containing nucleoside triphosphate hydrolase, leucine-rich repeat domain, L n=1 Tax=Rosa chinensis TaxID=74649 RepID=A0A2P6PTN8_ROSCH|nr:putative disease resistance protein At4g19050 [Rosa chinensis]XP_024162662.1 putative disease resistance protein At4g19050 [Rosa chinensis]XP_024162663.1 putative disease resistance protein At4g19050 [Rosa chinensis]XP_040363911.1 putative disease resistance protein At4g19050 [Rosa chinensis]XP_040363912.1 putative disease resistance protein At4g19050 [Rosa chinensis]XP_040363913.1 putative disease resistance protein At4g19050 [Rosa chinensis]XP_040363914.1 putative disease resistance prot
MADIVITVVGKLAEYTVAPVMRQFGYLINYKSNVKDLREKVTSLTAKREGVLQRVDTANRNLEAILPEVQNWLERVDQTIKEKETCFEEGRVAKATTCCSSNGWCPNLKVRHSLSRTAKKMAPNVDHLITDGNFTTITCRAPPRKIDYPAIQYPGDSTEAPAKGASSSSGTSDPAKPPAPMDLSERLKYRLPYTKDLLTALQDDKISMIGISGTIRVIDTVTTKEFMKRMKQKKLFEEVAMAVVSQDPDLERIQGEIAEMLDLKLENGSLVERAERLRAVLQASDSKKILVILTDICEIPDLEAIGISRVDIKKSCKIMLISQLSNVFGEMGTQSNFKLLSQSTPRARPVEFESRISVIRDVMDALTDDESNPIVICGMGGIGKTTLVMEIAAKASEVDLFDHVVIAEFTQEPDLIKIQCKIANALDLELKAEDERVAKLRERLSMDTKKVLVILDNFWGQLDLWELGIPISRDPKSCKLLVSSRNQDIFKDMKTKKNFLIGSLLKHDAWSLFKKVAGCSIESDSELRPIAEQVLDECDGLPVAISTVGRALQDEKIPVWRNAVRQLRMACPKDVPGVIEHVYGKIEFSYECLPSEEAKSCFLLCCIFPEGEEFPIEFLVMFAIGLGLFKDIDSISGARNYVITVVETLKCRSLLLDGDGKDCFRMHDVVRDVAVYIASKELAQKKSDKLERRYMERGGVELNDWLKSSSLRADMSTTELLVLGPTDGIELDLPATIFDGMENLKVLMIWCSILPSLSLLKNLQTLSLGCCRRNIDVIGELRSLMILRLYGSGIKQLPDTFKNLSNLRLLNLTGCTELKVISPGVISSLSRLEELYMPNNFHGWLVEKLGSTETINWISQLKVDAQPEEVDRWKKFNRLAVERLASAETTTDQVSQLEDEESSESEELDFLGYLFAEYVRDLKGDYDDLTRWAKSMDWRVGLLSELLSLSRLTTLEVVLPPIEILRTSKLFHKLERFKISIGWDEHEDLEDLEGNYLRVYSLDGSSLADTEISLLLRKTNQLELKMKNLRDPLNVLDVNCCANLESLALKDCDSLDYLIDMTLKQDTPRSVFPVLNYLEINGARRLKEIFHGDLPLGSLQKLERLTLRDCKSLEAIFALEGSEHHVKEINFPSLTKLELKGLPSFTFQSLDLNCCANLESLTLKDYDSLEYLIDMTLKQDTPRSVFPVLNYLEINRARRLKEIFHGEMPLGSLQKLERLTLWDCKSLEAIFAMEGSGHHVKEINFLCLTKLELKGLPSFTFQSLDLNCCANLKSLTLKDCDSLEYLIDMTLKQDTPRSVFPVLNYLEINRARRMKEIFHGEMPLGSLQKLERLTLGDCKSLEAIFAMEGSGHHVKEINFLCLTKLELKGLPSFTFQSLDLNCCANLKSLTLKDCDSLEYLIDMTLKQDTPRSVFPVLNYLEINGARRLKEIFHGELPLGSLQKLERLTLRDCQSLEAIFALEGSGHHVKEINFLCLTKLELKGLPSFTCQSLDLNCCANLESLTLKNCDSLEYLIDMTLKQDNPRSVFPVLNYLEINRARRLKEIFHGDLPLGSLQKLERLTLRDCQSLEEIFALEGSGHHVKEINFLCLTKLELKGLPSFTFQSLDLNCCANLESLTLEDCDSLECLIDQTLKQDTPRSVFPVLNYLEINGARRLKEIFHGDLPLGSLQKLERLLLQNLPALTTIWTIGSQSRWLGDLAAVYDISIWDCQSLEAIFALEGSGHHVKEINFLSLRRLKLKGLPSFTGMSKSTCKGMERQLEVSSLHHNSLTVEHSLFSDPKVVFPVLESLNISRLGNLKEIWNSRLSPNSFSELTTLTVKDCDKLLHLVPTQMQNRLQRLEYIKVRNCSSLEEIFEVGRLTVNEGNASISQSDKIPSNISQSDQGMQINDIMDFKQSCQGFQNLTVLVVRSCGSLRYLLSPSIARGLVKLGYLDIRSCENIEAIVAADEGEETENESMLPQLYYLHLGDLPNLGSFSQGKYTFDWPRVRRIKIKKCNKMNNFCSGSLSIRREVKIIVRDSGENLEQELNDSKKES